MSERLTDRDALATQPATGDLFHVVDVSDTADSPEGTSKKITYDVLIPDSSTTVKGKVELATDAETLTGTDTARAMTPSNLTAKMDTDGTLAGNSDTRIPSQKAVKDYVTNNGFNGANFFAPRGFLLNGQFTVTDSGSGIVVAIKTSAGTDPTASDVVYIRIGNTIRSITSALSVTLADGTNWFNSGSAELATKEIDYFLYAVWDSNSSAVALGFARIPYGNLVSDFSATTINEKYIAGQSGFTSTDEVEVIGRFAATLSAGAGYTWSVPTYTAINLIQRPIYETRLLTWVPTWTGYSANPTHTAQYRLVGNRCWIDLASSASGTSNATTNRFTGPFNVLIARDGIGCLGNGLDNGGRLSTQIRLDLTAGSNLFTFFKDGTGTAWTGSGGKWISVLHNFEI